MIQNVLFEARVLRFCAAATLLTTLAGCGAQPPASDDSEAVASVEQGLTCLTLPPVGPVSYLQDAAIVTDPSDPTKANAKLGASTALQVGANGTATSRSLFAADLLGAGVPPGSTIVSASLSLKLSQNPGQNPLDVYAGTTTWSESSVSWNQIAAAPGGGLGALLTTVPTAAVPNGTFLVIPLPASTVQSWLVPATSFGVVLDHPSAGRATFASLQAPAASRPSFTVCYDPGSCVDGLQNQGESDVDCGGPCGACANGLGCFADADCQSGSCIGGVCASGPTCSDGVQNQGETGIDCGGPCAACAPPGSHVWSRGFGSSSTAFSSLESITGTGVDAAGNVYVAAWVDGAVDLGTGPLPYVGGTDILLAKVDSAGNLVWAKTMGSSADDRANSLVVTPNGDVYVVGAFYGPVDFGGGLVSPVGSSDAFALKLDTNGAFQWVKRTGGPGGDIAYSVALDPSGSVLVAGLFGTAGFAQKLTSAGGGVWLRTYSGGGGVYVSLSDIAVGPAGDVVFTGHYSGGSVDFGGGPLPQNSFYATAVLAKLTSAGAHVFSLPFTGTSGYDIIGQQVTIDGSGSVITSGKCSGTVDFGGGPGICAGVYLLKTDGAGAFQWSHYYFDQGFRGVSFGDIKTGANDDIFIGGGTWGKVDFGGGLIGATQQQNRFDAFILKLDASAGFIWQNTFVGFQVTNAASVSIDATGALIAGGSHQSSTDFGGGPLATVGSSDAWVGKFAP